MIVTVAPLRIAGSLVAGIVLMILLAVVLAWATFIDSEYGSVVSTFAVYGSRWFALLLGLLGLNILCSMLLRLPWKRHHLPFLITHTGILILLFGCLWTWTSGEEAQLTLCEGMAAGQAIKPSSKHFSLKNERHDSPGRSEPAIRIPFDPGPFSWEDYDREKWLQKGRKYSESLWLAVQMGRRDHVRLSQDLQGVLVEVEDYYANSISEPVSPLELNILWKKMKRTTTELGDVKETPRNWERVRLDLRGSYAGYRELRGTRAEMSDGESIGFYVTTMMAEVESFRRGTPDGSLSSGDWGQIVLSYGDSDIRLDVERLIRDTANGARFPVPGTNFTIGDLRFKARIPGLSFVLYGAGEEKAEMHLNAREPESNTHALKFGVFGNYWFDPAPLLQKGSTQIDPSILRIHARPRLDILQGPDRKLHYRFWDGKNLLTVGTAPEQKLPTDPKATFVVGAGTPDEGEVVVERFAYHDLPGRRFVARPVGKGERNIERARMKVTVDGKEDYFWLRPSQQGFISGQDQVRFVYGDRRTVAVLWNYDTIDLGFGVFLKKFERRLEPGTNMSSHYSSLVDFVRMKSSENGIDFVHSLSDFDSLKPDVLISMNQPAVFSGKGRSYRLYQSSYEGPYHPNDSGFFDLYDGRVFSWETKPRESIYRSTLSVNYDPGRGLKYLGSFLIVLGIAWFVYRKKTAA